MAFKPLIGVTACVKQIGLHPYHISGDKYVRAVSVGAQGLPVVIPSLVNLTEIDDLLGQLDGLLLTGSPSNVEPFHYQGPASAPGMLDHREADSPDVAVQYAPAHAVSVIAGGVFEALELPDEFQVNSIHSQGIDRLAPGLRAEAVAPDGLIEAISVEHSLTFALGVQWHPEWQVLDNPSYLKIFQAFGAACRQRAAKRSQR